MQDINTAKGLIETNIPKALELAHSVFLSSRENGFDKGIGESYVIVGRCCIQKGDIGAQKALNTALKFAEKIQDKKLISDCYFYLGRSCYITGDLKQQLEWYDKAFALRKELNDQKLLADSYHGYGNVYLAMNKDSMAEHYFNLSKDIRAILHDRSGLAALCNNLGIIASNRGDTATYMSLMYQAIEMNEETGNKRYLAVNHGNLGMIFREKKMFDSATQHCQIAFEIRKANGFKDHLSGSYTDLGKIAFAQKKYTDAVNYYKQGAALAKSISGTEWLVGNYESLHETYMALDSAEQANYYKKLAEDVKREHQNDTALTKLLLPSSFDFKEPQSNAAWPFVTGGGLVVVCAAVFGAYRRKKKQTAHEKTNWNAGS